MKNIQFNNPEVRQAFLTNPKLAFETYFDTQLDDVNVKIVINTKSTNYFVMPAADYNDDLSEISAAAGCAGTVASALSLGTVTTTASTISTAGSASSAA